MTAVDPEIVAAQEAKSGEEQSPPDRFARTWESPPGLLGVLRKVQNDPLAKRYLLTSFAFFLIGGIQAILMRIQLGRPENPFLNHDIYNQLFTMHGTTMMFLFAVPFLEAIGIALLPAILGNRDMPFPRLNALGYWTFLFGGILLYSSFLFGLVPDGGWFAYVPLTGPVFSPGLGIDFWLLGLGLAEIVAIGAAIEFIIGIFLMRAPGMTLSRMPIFGWAMLVMAFMILFGFTPLLVGDVFLEMDRKIGTKFFDPEGGGSPVLWQHLFWIFGHPEVYIQFVPATGIVSTILPVFARRPLVTYTLVVLALIAIGFLSFGLWVHHMFTVGLSILVLAFFSMASSSIAVPSGIQFFAWIATLWTGRPVFKTPMLFIIGFVIIFIIGGITGVMVGSVPFDWQVHDSFFVVAHFHYVLFGGVVFPIFAAIYYWFPNLMFKLLDERLGRWNFWLVFIGFNVTFFPMHISGLLGMPRRVYTYEAGLGWELPNLISTVGVFILAAGIAVLLVNIAYTLWRGEQCEKNPWKSDGLEWLLGPEAGSAGHRQIPIIRGRNPLWDQERFDVGDERTMAIVRGLAETPDTWRAALVTTPLTAEPQSVQHMAGPSIWPFVASVALAIASVGELTDRLWLMGGGLLLTVVSVIAWFWPSSEELRFAESDESAKAHGLPILRSGPAATGWWAMLLILIVLFACQLSMYYSYFYLHTTVPDWPPGGYPIPEAGLPILAGVVLLVGLAPARWAERAIRRGVVKHLQIGLALTILPAILFLGLMGWHLWEVGFSAQSHAYGSIFYTIAWFEMLLVLLSLIMLVVVLIESLLGHYNHRRFLGVQNVVLFWSFTVVAWLPSLAVLYGIPRLY